MIRFLINSTYLFKVLTRIDFDAETVQYAEVSGGSLVLITDKQSIKINATITGFTKSTIRQKDRNWADVGDIVGTVPEQPIVIEIREAVVNIIFQA